MKVVSSASRVQFLEQGGLMQVSSLSRTVYWSTDDPSFAFLTNSHQRPFDIYYPTDFVFSPDGLSVMDSRGLEIWELRDLVDTSPPWTLKPTRLMINANGMGCVFSDGMQQQPDGSWEGTGWSRSTTSFDCRAGLSFLGGRWIMTQDGALFANSHPFGEKAVFVWGRLTRELLHSFPHEEYGPLLVFSHDEKSLISITNKDCVVWNLESGVETLRCSTESSNNYYLALNGLTGIKVLDLETGGISTIADDLDSAPHALTYTEDGATLLAIVRIGDEKNILNAFDAETGEKLDVAVPLLGAGIPNSLAPLDDDYVFCRFGPDKWWVVNWKEGRVLRSHRTDEPYSNSDEEIEKAPWRQRTDAILLNPYHYLEMGQGTSSHAVSRDGRFFAIENGLGTIEINSLRSNDAQMRVVECPKFRVRSMDFSPDSARLVVGFADGWLRSYDLESCELLEAMDCIPVAEETEVEEIDGMQKPKKNVIQVGFSPDGAKLYTVVQLEPDWTEERSESLLYGRDRLVLCIRDAETLMPLDALEGGDEMTGIECEFSSDGALFLRKTR